MRVLVWWSTMHDGHSQVHSVGRKHAKRLAAALALTVTLMVVQAVGGLLAGSLALVADAAHMLTDAGGLALALLAIRIAARPATPEKTYGYLRAEILSAMANAVVLLLLSGYILYEAYHRLFAPPEILAWPMLVIAVAGLAVNLASMKLLAAGADESLNVKGAYVEVLSDMLGSLGVIVAAVVVMLTGWTLIDPIVAAGIGLFIVPRTWGLLKHSTNILLEGAPLGADVEEIRKRLMAISGVVAVHDIHIWTITSGFDSMTAHVVVHDFKDARRVLSEACDILESEFDLDHVTIQVEDPALWDAKKRLHA